MILFTGDTLLISRQEILHYTSLCYITQIYITQLTVVMKRICVMAFYGNETLPLSLYSYYFRHLINTLNIPIKIAVVVLVAVFLVYFLRHEKIR